MPKNSNKCQGFETFQRMNYLSQIQHFMAANVKNTMVSSYYGNLMTNIAKKSVLRIDPKIKRTTCKKCKVALLPDMTAQVKIKSNKKSPIVIWKCLQCNFVKQYSLSNNVNIWTERPESIVHVLDYGLINENKK